MYNASFIKLIPRAKQYMAVLYNQSLAGIIWYVCHYVSEGIKSGEFESFTGREKR